MAHYDFRKDLEDSQKAVDMVLDYFIDNGNVAHELEGKKEQKFGDIRMFPGGNMDRPVNYEIKYDIMSKKTGNLCFEVANNKSMTGIMKTKADRIIYVCPEDDCHKLYWFTPTRLKEFLFDTMNKGKIRWTNGGDRNKFMLALVNKTIIESDDVCSHVVRIPNAQL